MNTIIYFTGNPQPPRNNRRPSKRPSSHRSGSSEKPVLTGNIEKQRYSPVLRKALKLNKTLQCAWEKINPNTPRKRAIDIFVGSVGALGLTVTSAIGNQANYDAASLAVTNDQQSTKCLTRVGPNSYRETSPIITLENGQPIYGDCPENTVKINPTPKGTAVNNGWKKSGLLTTVPAWLLAFGSAAETLWASNHLVATLKRERKNPSRVMTTMRRAIKRAKRRQ